MKCSFALRALACAGLMLVSASAPAAVRKSASAKPAETASQRIEVELVHQLGADKDVALRKLVERFNAQSRDGQVVVSDRAWAEGALPQMTIVSEQDEDPFLAKARYKPLWQVMKEAGLPLAAGGGSKQMVHAAVDAANRTVALPVALSTPVVFYNKDLLEKVGVGAADVPKTWRAWIDVLGRFYTQGVRCPMTVSQPVFTLYENASLWNNQAITVGGKAEQFAGNGLVQVKHMAMMSSWRKSGYLYYYGRGNEAEARFAKGECGVLLAPSGAYPSLTHQAGFQVGVAAYPYHDDAYGAPARTVADGPALWVANGRSAAEYKLIARFVQFWLQPDSQADWQLNAGYLPLSRAGVLATGSNPKDETLATRQAFAQLNNKPGLTGVTAFTHRPGVRRILAEEIEQVFDDKKPPKQGLDDAVQRIRLAEGGCCRLR